LVTPPPTQTPSTSTSSEHANSSNANNALLICYGGTADLKRIGGDDLIVAFDVASERWLGIELRGATPKQLRALGQSMSLIRNGNSDATLALVDTKRGQQAVVDVEVKSAPARSEQ
jgi:hypothetical protein